MEKQDQELIDMHMPNCKKCGRPRIECWCGHTIETHPEENTPRLYEIGKLLDKMSALLDKPKD